MVVEAAHHGGDLRLDRFLARAVLRRFRGGSGKPGELAPEGAVGEQEELQVGPADWPSSTSAGMAKPWVVVGAEVYIVIS